MIALGTAFIPLDSVSGHLALCHEPIQWAIPMEGFSMANNRIEELEAWAQETGLPLPMPAEEIIYLEDQGMLVDLVTGEVFENPEEGEATIDEELEIMGL
jgi:hypothetical protein